MLQFNTGNGAVLYAFVALVMDTHIKFGMCSTI